MFTYVLNPDEVIASKIKIFIPHVKIQPATKIALLGLNYTPVETLGDFGYFEYFKQRWEEGESFINVEQDVVVWPGAIRALWDCPEPWCVYDFHLLCHQSRNLENEKVGVPIGCVKISAEAIKKTPGIWKIPIEWVMCEQHITKKLLAVGIKPHQHHPGVVNSNEALLPKEVN